MTRPKGIPETKPRAPGGGRKSLPADVIRETPLRIDRVSFRLEPELAKRLADYEHDVANPRSETMNDALQQFLDIEALDEYQQADIERMIRERFPERYMDSPVAEALNTLITVSERRLLR